MRVRMLKTERFTPPEQRAITVKYLDGVEYTVKTAWGAAMVASGAAVEVKAPPRKPVEAVVEEMSEDIRRFESEGPSDGGG